jgi:hypothetical protein
MKTPPELDTIAKVVLAYRPKPKTPAAKRRVRRAKKAKAKWSQVNNSPKCTPTPG